MSPTEIINATGIHRFFKPLWGGIGHIVSLHRICPETNSLRLQSPKSLEISPIDLEKAIIRYNELDYEFISLDDLHNILTNNIKYKKKFVAFTIDDGYSDVYYHAFPLFKKYNIPFTVYVTTCFPDKSIYYWWYIIEYYIIQNNYIKIHFNNTFVEYITESIEQKNDAYLKISAIIKSHIGNPDFLPNFFRENSFFDHKKFNDYSLTWDQIIELSNSGIVTIGAHTINHRVLKNLINEESFNEIRNSKERIESFIGKSVHHFSYPFGGAIEAGQREYDFASEIGFKTATTSKFGNIFPAHKNHLNCLPRVGIDTTKNINSYINFLDSGIIHFKKNKFNRIILVD